MHLTLCHLLRVATHCTLGRQSTINIFDRFGGPHIVSTSTEGKQWIVILLIHKIFGHRRWCCGQNIKICSQLLAIDVHWKIIDIDYQLFQSLLKNFDLLLLTAKRLLDFCTDQCNSNDEICCYNSADPRC